MSCIDPDPLKRAVERLMGDIDTLTSTQDDESTDIVSPERLEKMARAISAQLKAMGDIQDHNVRAAQDDEGEKYLRYEDLPPPSPEDRARFIQRFYALVGQIETGNDIPDYSDQGSSQ